MQKLEVISQEVLKRITPTQADRAKITTLAKELQQRTLEAIKEQGVDASVRVEGSVAKDTWLRESPEIDIFMRLPISISHKALGKISLKIARKATKGAKQIERFAEHPYLEAFIGDVRINIVPCYNAKSGEWKSATDRTPFHTDYVKKHLDESLRGEVRLLKKFLQGIKTYGAEIRTGGFSGYLCELLILRHKSFIGTLRAFSKYTQRTTIDIEGYYAGREKEVKLLFQEPLVIVDPVDKRRNVASAVRRQKLYTLIAAARTYLKFPNKMFFYPPKIEALATEALKSKLDKLGTSFIFLKLDEIEAVPDVLWGQLYKTQRALRKLAETNDFRVLRGTVWSNEKELSVLTFELEQHNLPSVKKHLGPPIKREKECEKFLSKYANNDALVSGPYIEEGRWIVELQRRFVSVVQLLKNKLQDGGRNIGVAELMAQAFREKLTILVNSEVVEVCEYNWEFAQFLTSFLSGKPFWLRAA